MHPDFETRMMWKGRTGLPMNIAIDDGYAYERFGLNETGVSVAVNALEQEMQTAQGLAVAGLPFLELLPSDVRPELLHGGKFSFSWEFPHHFREAAATRGNGNSSARFRSPKRPARVARDLSAGRNEAPLESPTVPRLAGGIC